MQSHHHTCHNKYENDSRLFEHRNQVSSCSFFPVAMAAVRGGLRDYHMQLLNALVCSIGGFSDYSCITQG